MATDHNFKIKKGLHVLGTEGIYLTDTNTRIAEGSGNSVRIITSTGHIDIGSMNSGWVHMQANKNIYILPSSYVSIDGNLQPYSDSARTLGANGTRWSHTYTDNVTVTDNVTIGGTISSGAITSTGNSVFTGGNSDGTGNAFEVKRGGNSQQQALRIQNTGEVVISNNYLYAASSGTSFYSQGDAVFRATIRNDSNGGADPVKVSDALNVTGNIQSNGNVILQSSGRNLTNIGTISSGAITATTVNTGQGANELYAMNQNVRTTDSPTFDELTVTDFVKSSGNNLKLSAGGTHVINIDLNRHFYPQTHNSTDIGFSSTLAFKDAFFSGTGNFGTINTGQGATEVYLMNQNVRSSDSPTFQDLTIQGNLAITGDINSYNVTDLDVVDKTITLGVGGTASANDGGGIIVDGANAKLTWNNTNSYWQMNKKLAFNDTATTSNQQLGIVWSGFDKEGTTDFSDSAKIIHTTNTGGHAGSVLLIESQNDANDGIAFTTNSSSNLKHNSNTIWTAGNDGASSGLDADLLDGVQGSVYVKQNTGNLIDLFANQNGVNELRLDNNRQDLGNVGVSKVSGYNSVETSNMTFYRGGGGSSGFIRFQNKPTNAAALTDVFQVGDGSTVGYGVDILAGGLRINGTTVIDSSRNLTNIGTIASRNITLSIPDGGGAPANTGIFHIKGYEGRGAGIRIQDSVNSASNANSREWFIGSGYAQSGFSIGYASDGSQSSYSAQNKFSISTAGHASFAGNITASGNLTTTAITINGNTAWHAGNDGSGSGLDADLLDGQHGSYYRNASNINAGTINTARLPNVIQLSGQNAIIKLQETDVTNSPTWWHVADGGNYSIRLNNTGSYPFQITTNSTNNAVSGIVLNYATTIQGNTAWHAGNDGSGSGLDADTLDGINSGSFLRSDATDSATGSLTFSGAILSNGHSSGSNYLPYTDGNFYFRAPNVFFDSTEVEFNNIARVVTGSIGASNTTKGLMFDGNYQTGQYRHRFRKQDKSGGVPLFIDASGGTANSYTEQARFGAYTGNSYEFEVFGDINATGNLYDGGNAVWHAGNDGSGSGLDADTLDSVQGSNYGRLDQANVFGAGTHSNYFRRNNTTNYTNAPLLVESYGGSSTTAGIGFHISGSIGRYLYMNNVGDLYWNSSGSKIWHAGNDGSGSGLDADTLDGQHASAFTSSASPTFTGTVTLPSTVNGPAYDNTLTNVSSGAWHTIASFGGGRSAATIEIWDSESSRHNYVKAEIGWSYGHGTINILNSTRHGNRTIARMRLMYNSSDQTYGGARLEVYLENWATSYNLRLRRIHKGGRNGWGDITWAPSSGTVSGYAQYGQVIEIGSSIRGTFGTSGKVIAGTGIDVYGGNKLTFHTASSDGISTERGFIDAQEGGHLRIATSGGERIVFQDGGVGGTTNFTINGDGTLYQGTSNTIWHAGNDGSGSGLDADLLDGQQGSYYRNAGNLDAGTIPAARLPSPLNSSQAHAVTGSAFATTGSPSSVLEYQQASSITDTKLAPGGDWYNTIRMGHGNPYSYYSNTMAVKMTGTNVGQLYIQTISNNTAQGWRQVWDSSSDGSGSGLDADTVDGIQAASFLRSDAADTATGKITFNAGIDGQAIFLSGAQNFDALKQIGFYSLYNANASGHTNAPFQYGAMISSNSNASGGMGMQFAHERTGTGTYIRGMNDSGDTWYPWQEVWTSGTDGSGSGLDADLLDGQQGSYYYSSANPPPTYSKYLRSDAGDTATGTLDLNGRVNIGYSVARPAALNSDSVAQARIGGTDVFLYVASLNSTGGYKLAMQAARASDFASFDLNLQSNGGNLQRAGNKVWDAGNDGSGSGLDADLLDGVQLANIARTDVAETFTSNLTVNNNLYIGDGDDGYFYNDTAGRTAFRSGDFYIQSSVGNYYNYATNQYIGDSSGDNIYFRGNVLSGTGWGINGAGKLTTRDHLLNAGYHLQRSDHHTGHLEGSYNNIGANSTNSNPIYTIGSSYNPASTTLGNMYGIGFSKNTASFMTGDLDAGDNNGWGLYVAADGDARIFLNASDGIISSTGQHYADGNVVWNAGNDGSGSGLDADTVDGIQGASLLRSDTADSYTDIRASGSTNTGRFISNNSWGTTHQTSNGYIQFGPANSNYAHIYTDRGSFYFNKNTLYANGNTMWTAGNDGSGSGLDADNLDGYAWTSQNKAVAAQNWTTEAGNGQGLSFWGGTGTAGSNSYAIFMGTSGTYGRVDGETTSDYNMYFKMNAGTNRGFVFRNSTNNVVGIDSTGNLRAEADIVAYSGSDIRLKDNLTVISNPLEKLSKLSGYSFEWNSKQSAYAEGKKDIGLVAQEVEEVLPEIVKTRQDGFKGLQYEKLIPLLVEGMKEQQQQIEELKQQVKDLQGQK